MEYSAELVAIRRRLAVVAARFSLLSPPNLSFSIVRFCSVYIKHSTRVNKHKIIVHARSMMIDDVAHIAAMRRLQDVMADIPVPPKGWTEIHSVSL